MFSSVWILIAICQTAAAAIDTPPPPPADAPAALWQEITALEQLRPSLSDYGSYYSATLAQRERLLARLERYLLLYPGGVQRDEAIRKELAVLFEIGALGGGAFERLTNRAAELARSPPSPAALEEAEYWLLVSRQASRRAAASQPIGPLPPAKDAPQLAAYREYLNKYPSSRYAPRFATIVFEDAVTHNDRASQKSILGLMQQNWPQHAATAQLAATQRRLDALGQPFWLTFRQADGSRIDTREYGGQVVLIVVWAAFDGGAKECAKAVDEFCRGKADFRPIGVNLDDAPPSAAVAAESGLAWPQFNDGLGWANSFAREWGVRAVPTVFVIDRDSRLVGAVSDDSWRKLARRAAGLPE